MIDFNYDQPYAVVAVLVEKDGKFLLVKEGDGPYTGLWSLPAGKWDHGEQLVDGAKREFHEETGYFLEPTGIVGFYSRTSRNPLKTVLRVVFTGEISGEAAKELNKEILEIKWLSADEIQAMTLKEIRTLDIINVVRDYQTGNLLPLDAIKFWEE